MNHMELYPGLRFYSQPTPKLIFSLSIDHFRIFPQPQDLNIINCIYFKNIDIDINRYIDIDATLKNTMNYLINNRNKLGSINFCIL